MINSRFIQAEQKPGDRARYQTITVALNQLKISNSKFQISDLRFQISDFKSEIDLSLNYYEKIVARNSAANRPDRRLRNEAAVPVRRTHDLEAKLQRKEFHPHKAARR